jgi:general secretion pathway protein D
MMTTNHALSRLRRLILAPTVAAVVAALSASAEAQPTTRGAPVLRTPSRRPDPGVAPAAVPGTPAVPPAPGATTPGTATPGAAGAGGADDPMAAANVKIGPREIDFKPKPGNFGVNFNLDDADLPDLVKAISNITGRRFIYGGKLRQIKATVYSPEKVTAAEAYSAFLSILENNGMTVIPHGRFLKIIETPGVVTETTPIYGTAAPVPDEDRYITRLYRLAHIDANEASNVLMKFKSKEGDITVYPPGNLLIVTDTGTNLQRMLRIVEEIDVGGAGEQIYVEPVNYTNAAEIANKLNDLLDLKKGGSGGAPGAPGAPGGGGGRGGARIVADERGNSLIIVANDPDYKRLLELINRLDVKQSGEGEIHVQPLQYAACKDLSQTLNQILGTTGGLGAAGRPGAPGSISPRTGGMPGAAGAGTDEVFEGRVRISCDEATNSLVTISSLRDYAQLKTVLERLDAPRRQVFIEAVIMDLSVNRSLAYGISYHAGAPTTIADQASVVYGGSNIGDSALNAFSTDNLQGLALGVRGPVLDALTQQTGLSIPAFGVVLHALAQDGDANILATPHVIATDNIAAEISIGENIPLQTNVGGLSGLAGAAGAAGAGALGGLGGLLGGGLGGLNAARQDIGTKLKIIPHVNESDQVRLELTEEISEAGAPLGALGAIPIKKRTANTTLIVRDQQTVVIGGLMRDAVKHSYTKIPILGDIPILGVLFKKTTETKEKQNLLLILTPYVIRDQDDLRAIFERKMQERQEFLDRYFVFNDGTYWQPPRDFSRSNGLLEDIRQSLLKEDEKFRIEEETRPKARKTHEPVEPIPMPTLGGRGGGAASVTGDDGGANAPAPPGVPVNARTRGRLSVPAQRVE